MLKIVQHKSVIMWLLGAALGTLAASACGIPSPDTTTTAGTPSDSSGDTESGDPTTGGGSTGDAPGFVCADVGKPCTPNAGECAKGLLCVSTDEAAPAPEHVCAAQCNLEEGWPSAAPCPIGWCDVPIGESTGMCRDSDSMPAGLCEGIPSCAGDPCVDGCANGLSCIVGACAFACATAADCTAGQACLAGACFDGDGLADPCN